MIRYTTEEELMAVLQGDRLNPDLAECFENAMVVDAASHGWNNAIRYMCDEKCYSPHGCDYKND